MPDLIVTSAVLDDSSGKLAAIRKEFDNASDRVPDHNDVWGQNDLKSAMQKFVWNWGTHRQHISDAVDQLRQKVDDTIAGWTDTEKQLSEGLTTETQ